MDKHNLSDICKNFKSHINKTIYKYLLILMKYIFLEKEIFKNQKDIDKIIDKLKAFTEKINENIIKEKENFIKIEPENEIYTYKNLMNILKFVKKQNLMFAGDILEGILIIIFSYSIKTSQEDEFGKYVFSNFSKLREKGEKENQNIDLIKWFGGAKEKFKPKEIKDIKELLINDSYKKDNSKLEEKKPVLIRFLFEITKTKLNFILANTKNSESTRYINRDFFNMINMEIKLYDALKYHRSAIGTNEEDFIKNSTGFLFHFLFDKQESPIQLIFSLLASVYIYDQNRNSPFITPLDPSIEEKSDIKKDKDFVKVPYTYELSNSNIEGKFSNIIISPISVEPRIEKIYFFLNNIREPGLFELGKMLSFNKKIKSLYLKRNLIYGYYLDFFNSGFGIFDNYNLENLNLSNSYLNENAEYSLPKLISHLKGLKTLILNGNIIKDGGTGLFILLKKLFRHKKIKLENLYLNDCFLGENSFYELSELLKSPYCMIKSLYISSNSKNKIINFFKKIKLNKNLEELFLYKCNLKNGDIDDICKIISNTNIKNLNLSKNDFKNLGKCLKIIFRSKIVERKDKKINKSRIILGQSLINLDLSNIPFEQIDYRFINLINELVNDNSTLSCLDLSHIFYGMTPDRIYKKNQKYKNTVEDIVKTLTEKKKYYEDLLEKRLDNLLNIKIRQNKNDKLKYLNEEIIEYIREKILSNKKLVIYPAFLKEKCIKLIEEKILGNKEKYKKLIQEENIKEYEKEVKKEEKGENKFTTEKNATFINKLIDYIIIERNKEENIKINHELEFNNLILI